MSAISLVNVQLLNNPAKFTDDFKLKITFECSEQLKHDLEWKLTYVGSSKSADHDQVLDSILVGPIPVGVSKFVMECPPPNHEIIPQQEVVSVTVMLLSGLYNDKEFVRVGYYVNNEYEKDEYKEEPPKKVIIEEVSRNILVNKPRVTKFNIPWDNEEDKDTDKKEFEKQNEEAEEEEEDDDEAYGEQDSDASDVSGEESNEEEEEEEEEVLEEEELEDEEDAEPETKRQKTE
ncbi:nucleosome assembly factor [Hanseniaspora uvarum]|nr:nucleosome assembly factor [Hanseniaspora uvarum]